MNNEKLKQVLDSFFTNETQKILIIKGGWGIGKTYFWEDYIQNKIRMNQLPEMINGYSYASLFGIDSLSNLQDKIIVNTNVFADLDSSVIDTNGLLKDIGVNTNGILSILSKIPFIKEQVYDVTPYVYNLIRNQIICFDDLERCHQDFNIETLMGYADELVQKKQCKIIIIFNEEELDPSQKEKFDKYREKIIDIEVTYSPTLESNFNVAFAESNIDEDWQKKVRERCMLLGIDNIRVLKKIRYGLEEYWIYIQENEFPEKVRDSFIQNFVSFYSLYLEEKEERYQEIKNRMFSGLLTIFNIKDMSYISFWQDEKKDETLEEKEDRLLAPELLKKYLLESSSIFDDDIVFYINNGYISSDFIAKSKGWYENLQHEAKVLECEKKVSRIWDLYHSTFQDNLDDIIEVLNDLIKDEDIFDYLNLPKFLNLMKNLYFFQNLKNDGYKVQNIYPYIDQYLIKNKQFFLKSDSRLIFTSIESLSFGSQGNEKWAIDDYTRKEINKLRSTQYQNVEIWDLLKKNYETIIASPEEKQLLENLTKDEYMELFKKQEGPNLTRIIRQLYSDLMVSGKEAALESALNEIYQQSKLNSHRIEALKKTD